jgi:endonuclease-3
MLLELKRLPKKKAAEIFERLNAAWPHAHCELDHNNNFQLLLAVLLSAQTTDKAVNKAIGPIREKKPNFGAAELKAMGELKFLEWIRSLGLANTKARNAVAMASVLVEHFDGEVPSGQEELESLPGVGRKTANVVRNVLFGAPTMPVDTHVGRVAQRIGLAVVTSNLLIIEEQILKNVPEHLAVKAHHLLIFQGRYVCTARAPQCDNCSVQDICLKRI